MRGFLTWIRSGRRIVASSATCRDSRLAKRSCITAAMVEDDPTTRLTDRQRECLRLVGQLKKTEQIAGELGIAPSTVNTHIERAVALLGAANRRDAARMVLVSDTRPEKSPTEIDRLPETPPPSPTLPPPDALGRRRNDLTWGQRLGLALLALVLMCIGLAGLGAAIEQLSHWRATIAGGHKVQN